MIVWRLIDSQSNLQVGEMLNMGHHSSRNVENGPTEMFEKENEKRSSLKKKMRNAVLKKKNTVLTFLAIILL